MEPALARARTQPAPAFEDGFGRRQQIVSASKDPVEVLVLRREHVAVPGFEAAVRERIDQVSRFHHESFVRVRGLARLAKGESNLAVVSDRTDGLRLSYLIDPEQQRSLEMNGALMLLGQLVDALVAFHEHVPGCHGAIGPERLILTAAGRLVIADHVFGTALPKLGLDATELWGQMRVSVPVGPSPVFDQQTDILQAGSVALALMLGRPLGDGYPNRIGDKSGAASLSISAALELVPDDIAAWVSRAIHRRGHEPFTSSAAARDALAPILTTLDRVAARRAVLAFYSGDTMEAPVPSHRASGPIALVPPPAARLAAADSAPAPVAITAAPPPIAVVPPPAPLAVTPFVPEPIADEAEAHDADADEEGPSVAFGAAAIATPVRSFLVPMTRRTIGLTATLLMLLTTGGAFAAKSYFSPGASFEKGTLAVMTTPAGANVVVDGEHRGKAPLAMEVPTGDHVLQLSLDGASRTIPFTIKTGQMVSQVVDLPKVTPNTGNLQVRTEPSGARVVVDGQRRGVSPMTIDGLTPGVHMVTIEGQLGTVSQDVTIQSGVTSALVVPLGTPEGAPVSGWISVISPVDVQLFEKGQLLGSSRVQKIMASVGKHDLEIGNDALGYRVSRSVTVTPGQVVTIKLDPPRGSLSLNAVPWAEVWIDGERLGETPIGNVQLPIGQHEVVFRHPDLGEQRFTPTVTLAAPARVSADLRRKP